MSIEPEIPPAQSLSRPDAERPWGEVVPVPAEPSPDPAGKNLPMMKITKWGELECHNCKVSAMPMFLSQLVGGTVVDQTGLNGNYDFILEFAPDPTKADDTRPSIFI